MKMQSLLPFYKQLFLEIYRSIVFILSPWDVHNVFYHKVAAFVYMCTWQTVCFFCLLQSTLYIFVNSAISVTQKILTNRRKSLRSCPVIVRPERLLCSFKQLVVIIINKYTLTTNFKEEMSAWKWHAVILKSLPSMPGDLYRNSTGSGDYRNKTGLRQC